MDTIPVIDYKDWTPEERENPFQSKRILCASEQFWATTAPFWETFFPAGQQAQIPTDALDRLISYANAYAHQSGTWARDRDLEDYKRDGSLTALRLDGDRLPGHAPLP